MTRTIEEVNTQLYNEWMEIAKSNAARGYYHMAETATKIALSYKQS